MHCESPRSFLPSYSSAHLGGRPVSRAAIHWKAGEAMPLTSETEESDHILCSLEASMREAGLPRVSSPYRDRPSTSTRPPCLSRPLTSAETRQFLGDCLSDEGTPSVSSRIFGSRQLHSGGGGVATAADTFRPVATAVAASLGLATTTEAANIENYHLSPSYAAATAAASLRQHSNVDERHSLHAVSAHSVGAQGKSFDTTFLTAVPGSGRSRPQQGKGAGKAPPMRAQQCEAPLQDTVALFRQAKEAIAGAAGWTMSGAAVDAALDRDASTRTSMQALPPVGREPDLSWPLAPLPVVRVNKAAPADEVNVPALSVPSIVKWVAFHHPTTSNMVQKSIAEARDAKRKTVLQRAKANSSSKEGRKELIAERHQLSVSTFDTPGLPGMAAIVKALLEPFVEHGSPRLRKGGGGGGRTNAPIVTPENRKLFVRSAQWSMVLVINSFLANLRYAGIDRLQQHHTRKRVQGALTTLRRLFYPYLRNRFRRTLDKMLPHGSRGRKVLIDYCNRVKLRLVHRSAAILHAWSSDYLYSARTRFRWTLRSFRRCVVVLQRAVRRWLQVRLSSTILLEAQFKHMLEVTAYSTFAVYLKEIRSVLDIKKLAISVFDVAGSRLTTRVDSGSAAVSRTLQDVVAGPKSTGRSPTKLEKKVQAMTLQVWPTLPSYTALQDAARSRMTTQEGLDDALQIISNPHSEDVWMQLLALNADVLAVPELRIALRTHGLYAPVPLPSTEMRRLSMPETARILRTARREAFAMAVKKAKKAQEEAKSEPKTAASKGRTLPAMPTSPPAGPVSSRSNGAAMVRDWRAKRTAVKAPKIACILPHLIPPNALLALCKKTLVTAISHVNKPSRIVQRYATIVRQLTIDDLIWTPECEFAT